MENLIRDVRYSIRQLMKSPGFTLVVLITLALGIGINSGIFSIVNAVLLRSLPFRDAEQIVYLWGNNVKESNDHNTVSLPDYLDWKGQNQSFEAMSGYIYRAYNMTGAKEPEPVQGAMVSADFFRVIGVEPSLGRSFRADEERANVVVIGHSLWERYFNSDPAVVGKSITLSNVPFEIVGVMPQGFQFPRKDVEAWTTFTSVYPYPAYQSRSYRFMRVVGRLKPGVTLRQASVEMNGIAGRLEQQYQDSNSGQGINLVPIRDEMLGSIRPRLLLLWTAVGFILLIACANIANLMMARTATRDREIAIRTALGASRFRVVRQLLTESVVLSLLGGLLGLLVALLFIKLLIRFNPGDIPRLDTTTLDARSILFTFAIAFVTGIIFGLVPALQASKIDQNSALKEGGRGTSGGAGRRRLQNIVVVSEIALSLVLLVGTGLMLRSFLRLGAVNLGFDPKNVMSMYLVYSKDKYKEPAQQTAYVQRLLNGLEELPGVESASMGLSLPPEALYRRDEFSIEGRPAPDARQRPAADFLPVSPHYFKTLKIPLLSGREFTDADKADAPQVVIINQTLSRRLFPNENPIGKRINLGEQGASETSYEIVGVVGDAKYSGITDEVTNQLYFSYLQQPLSGLYVLLRTRADPAAMKVEVRKKIFAIDFEQPVRSLQTMEESLSEGLAQQRFNILLLSTFAILALVLTAVGIYGVIAYSVNQRKHELGIRMALGAQQSDVLKLIVKQGLMLAVFGVVIGLVAAFAVTRIIASLLYGVTATDPVTFIGTALLLTAVALLASFIPARSAAQVDPAIALRQE
jgi:putative ABC transport system permease protein